MCFSASARVQAMYNGLNLTTLSDRSATTTILPSPAPSDEPSPPALNAHESPSTTVAALSGTSTMVRSAGLPVTTAQFVPRNTTTTTADSSYRRPCLNRVQDVQRVNSPLSTSNTETEPRRPDPPSNAATSNSQQASPVVGHAHGPPSNSPRVQPGTDLNRLKRKHST